MKVTRVLVVGAAAAGLSTAEALRRKGYQGAITVIGAEQHPPYDRPPLSKQVLSGEWLPERTALRTREFLSTLGAEFLLGDAASGLDARSRTVRLQSGRALSADAIVVATGARPRMLPGHDGLAGVHVLRTLDDALALRTDLLAGSRLVVVGEGVLGAEIAATARMMGLDVVLAGPQPVPMALQVGPFIGGLLGDLHAERGVHLRLGNGVVGLVGGRDAAHPGAGDPHGENGRVTGVRLSTGEIVPADVAVVAIGASPSTEWLAGSGLRIDNGVVCDSRCRAADGVYAVGDVARWDHERLGRPVRLENRTNAAEQAMAVAAAILGSDEPYVPIPYFWTDQYDQRLQMHGFLPAGADVDIVEGDVATRRFVARYRSSGRVTGVLGWNMPKQARQWRQEITGEKS